MPDNTPTFDQWGICEVMGHKKYAGHITEQVIAGAAFIRVDVPEVTFAGDPPRVLPAFAKLVGASSIYCITPKAAPTKTVEKAVVDQRAIDRAVTSAVSSATQQAAAVRKKVLAVLERAKTVVALLEGAVADAAFVLAVETPSSLVIPKTSAYEPPRRAVAPRPSGDVTIGGTPQRMLNAMRFLESAGTSPASRAAVAALVSISGNTGSFRTYLSQLRAPNYITDGAGGSIALTAEGRAQANEDGLPTTRADLHAAWRSNLGGTPARMLDVLLVNYPDPIERSTLGEMCSIDASTGSFRTYLSQLRSPGLIVDFSKTSVRAADALFPDGLS